ncbi:ATP-binding protein [Natronoarchaeum rubrum]|uniref:ATP-binding protein n=1 Tax=Natronoarchaeum rubrum TaxID=755311 RepID=UPI002112B34E|nr:ATP-binding protein [Natronoarchaeum rubrum]
MTEQVSAEPLSAVRDGGTRSEPGRIAVAADIDDADRIAAMAPEECSVLLGSPGCVDGVDLWIVDESALDRLDGSFSDVDGTDPSVLLVVDDDRLSDERWSTIDDVVRRPLRPPVVRRRIENVLGSPRSDAATTATSATERVGIDCVAHPVVTATIEDGERIVRGVNPAFEEVFGYDADAVLGEQLSEWVVSPDERAEAADLVQQVENGTAVEQIVTRRTATGRRDVALKMLPVAGDDADAFVCYDDVTDEQCRKQQVTVLNRVLRHNIRNGMNVILGNAEMLAERVDDSTAVAAARAIEDAADDLVELGETAGSLQTTWDGTDRNALDAVRLVDRVRTDLRYDSSTPEIRIEAPESCPVLADAHLETAVRELCENAIRYAREGAPVVVRVAQDGDRTEITVCDRGPGLPEAERSVLRGDDETPLEHGSGLGLWIVNWIVTSLGGEISVADREPTGTAVTLSLPAGQRPADRPPVEATR